jgi:hypothetical protein
MARTLFVAAPLGLLILASGGLGAWVGMRWSARHGPASEPAGAPSETDVCQSDDREVVWLRARVQVLEEHLAAATAAPSAADGEGQPPPGAPVAEPAPADSPPVPEPAAPPAPPEEPALVVAAKLYEGTWARDAQERLVEATRVAGPEGETADVTCTHDECRVELPAAEGASGGERAEKIVSDVAPYLQKVNVESDESTGKTTLVFARRAVTQGG